MNTVTVSKLSDYKADTLRKKINNFIWTLKARFTVVRYNFFTGGIFAGFDPMDYSCSRRHTGEEINTRGEKMTAWVMDNFKKDKNRERYYQAKEKLQCR